MALPARFLFLFSPLFHSLLVASSLRGSILALFIVSWYLSLVSLVYIQQLKAISLSRSFSVVDPVTNLVTYFVLYEIVFDYKHSLPLFTDF